MTVVFRAGGINSWLIRGEHEQIMSPGLGRRYKFIEDCLVTLYPHFGPSIAYPVKKAEELNIEFSSNFHLLTFYV